MTNREAIQKGKEIVTFPAIVRDHETLVDVNGKYYCVPTRSGKAKKPDEPAEVYKVGQSEMLDLWISEYKEENKRK